MSIEMIPFTKEGFDSLHKELEHLKNFERPTVIQAISDARAHGDLRENAEYHAAREKQGMVEARIKDLEDKLSRAEIVDFRNTKSDTVRFGAWVLLSDEETGEEKRFRIVGDLEADIAKNHLSVSSPMARALLGKKKDEVVQINVPKGKKEYLVVGIDY